MKNWYFSNSGSPEVEFDFFLATTSGSSAQRLMSICTGPENSGSYALNSFGSENTMTV